MPSGVAIDLMRVRSSLPQYGQAIALKPQRTWQRPHTSCRSPLIVITENSGSAAHTGQMRRLQPSRLTRCCSTSAVRCRYGRAAQPSTSSSISISRAGCCSNQPRITSGSVGLRPTECNAAAPAASITSWRRSTSVTCRISRRTSFQSNAICENSSSGWPLGKPRVQRVGGRLDPRRRDAALHAPDRFDQIDLQRRRRRQLRLAFGERLQLEDVARQDARAARCRLDGVSDTGDDTAISSRLSASRTKLDRMASDPQASRETAAAAPKAEAESREPKADRPSAS